ncbi:MAG: mannose-1-phosphate guanylyltransferase [Coxiellaceae bacterium]|nr:mannose-1-phosphate guanylyltransferase [Coxiellaceae bacterium]
MKAIILAAGLGKRMLPLTARLPKPLLTVGPHTLIEHNLFSLKKAGITSVIINLHHCADQIISLLGDGEAYGLNIQYSHEKTQLMGTGGGIIQALPLLDSSPFLLVAADIWSDIALNTLTIPTHSDAHLIMVNNPSFHPKGDYSLHANNLIGAPSDRTLTFASIALLRPKLFYSAPLKPCALSDLLRPAITQQRVTGELYQGEWWNVGTQQILHALTDHISTCS